MFGVVHFKAVEEQFTCA